MYSAGTARLKDSNDSEAINARVGEVYLPHSCDDWRIGDRQAVEVLIRDLQALLTQMKPPKKKAKP